MPKFYSVLYTKKAPGKKRKNKSFADGLLAVDNASYTVYDEAGHTVAKETMKACVDLSEGAEVQFESWDLEIDQELPENDFRQRRQAMRGNAEIRPCPTENSGREQLPDLEKGSQAHASRLEDAFYAVIYTTRAPGKKRKNKSFKDGVLRLCSNRSILYDEEGKVIAERAGHMNANLRQESEMALGMWDAEVTEELTADSFRAGACFRKSGETLLQERLHASRSARADAGQGQTTRPLGSTPSSMGASESTSKGEKQSPAAVHERGAGDGYRASTDKLCPMSSPQLQQQQSICRDSAQVSSTAVGSAQVHMDSEPMEPREAALLQRVEGVVGAEKTQNQEDAPTSIGFLDDVSCLEVL